MFKMPRLITRLRKLTLLGAICTLIVNASGCGSAHSDADPRIAEPLVSVSQAEPAGSYDRAFTGVVAARVQSNLGFRVAGKVTERLVDTGQAVRKGQALMRLDRTDYTHAVASQSGTVDAARARMLQGAADEERYRGLVKSGAVSQSDYDRIKAEADSARALLAGAEAQLKVAQDEGDYSVLAADADGTVVETLTEPGQFVAAGQIVVRLARSGPREAAVNLPETLRPALGGTAFASLYGSDSTTPVRYPVRLRQLSDSADPATRTFEARYVLEGGGAKAPLGATVTVYLQAAAPGGAVAVPFGAITDEGSGSGVWLIDRRSSTVSFRFVTVLQFGGERALISGKIHSGDSIVATGGHYLQEGEHVRLVTLQAAMQ